MRDIEVLKRAKLYMKQLSDGTDPISGSAAPSDSLVHQPRLQRCFLYVADLLEEIIENEGKISYKKSAKHKLPFSITKEQQAAVEISEDAVGISIIAKRVGAVLDEDIKNLSGADINLWCLLKGYLREDVYAGKPRKVSSLMGEQLGITTLDRVNQKGFTYKYNVFDIKAQVFIIENLNIIASELAEHKNSIEAGEL